MTVPDGCHSQVVMVTFCTRLVAPTKPTDTSPHSSIVDGFNADVVSSQCSKMLDRVASRSVLDKFTPV